MSDITVSLTCEAPSPGVDACRLTVKSDGKFELEVDSGKGKKTLHIKPGMKSLALDVK